MDLKTFVTETIAQIVEGVVDARERCSKVGARLNPTITGESSTGSSEVLLTTDAEPTAAQLVRFDVALVATEGKGTKAGIGVVAGVLKLGASGHSQAEKSATSRVQFVVPLALPPERTE